MATKHLIDPKSLNEIFKDICEFAKNDATPDEYCKNDSPEEALQIHLSEYLSNSCDVLREVSIPAIIKLDGSGTNTWELDESLRIEDINKQNHYATGELKFHGKEMSDRDFVTEAKEDIHRMLSVAPYFFDTTMSFTLFITCDKQEREDVYKYAKQQAKIHEIKNFDVPGGYFAIAVQIIPNPQEDSHAPFYGTHWRERYEYLKSTKQLRNSFFPQRVRLYL